MAKIIWTEPSLNNLDDIAEYIALNNVAAAKRVVQNVFEKVDRLEQHPRSGKVPQELSNLGLREVIVNPCRIFYKHLDDKVFILHVMRQEQQLKKYILENL